MKFYNPFKTHIVQFDDGSYAIRKYILGYSWVYYNFKNNAWYDIDFVFFNSSCATYDLNALKQKMKDIQVEDEKLKREKLQAIQDEKLKRKSLNKYGTKI